MTPLQPQCENPIVGIFQAVEEQSHPLKSMGTAAEAPAKRFGSNALGTLLTLYSAAGGG